jgi:hypothetical protein
MPAANVTGTTSCSSFLLRSDTPNATLPVSYELNGLASAGTYLVVALLIGTGERALIAPYAVSLDTTGLHYNSPEPVTELNLVMQGTSAYDCN